MLVSLTPSPIVCTVTYSHTRTCAFLSIVRLDSLIEVYCFFHFFSDKTMEWHMLLLYMRTYLCYPTHVYINVFARIIVNCHVVCYPFTAEVLGLPVR